MTKAFVLAAGQGKRFLPFSEIKPKPLFKIGEISLIERNLINLKVMLWTRSGSNQKRIGLIKSLCTFYIIWMQR